MAAPAEEFAFSLRSERPLRSETCLAASEAASVSSGSPTAIGTVVPS